MASSQPYTRLKSPSGRIYRIRKDETGLHILLPRLPLVRMVLTVTVVILAAFALEFIGVASGNGGGIRLPVHWPEAIAFVIFMSLFCFFSNELHLDNKAISRDTRYMLGSAHRSSIPYGAIESVVPEEDGSHLMIRIHAPSNVPGMLTVEGFATRADRDWFYENILTFLRDMQKNPVQMVASQFQQVRANDSNRQTIKAFETVHGKSQ